MNIIFENVKIYKVQDELDVVVGQSFFMEILQDFPADVEIYTNKDPVLSIADDERTVTVANLGTSNIKFMATIEGVDKVLKKIIINAVTATQAIATTLNGTLGEPEPK